MGFLSKIFGGGGSSSANTSSTASQTTTNTDSSVGGSSGVIATGNSTINYLGENVAMSALDTASELGRAGLSASGDFVAAAVKINADNATVTENSRIGNNNLARDLAYNAIEKVQALAQPAEVQAANVAGKYIVYIAAAAAAVGVAFFAFRKK
jgi:hypothetical protein